MRYIGIDYGTKKVGLALSDEAGTMGFPHGIIPNTPRLLETIVTLIKEKKVEAVVMGESKDFSGKDNPIAQDARLLANQIGEQAGVEVFFEPEMLTSAEARRMHEPAEKTRSPKIHDDVDASAAALILTSFLSKQ
ncbi:MAG: Holliday junction resolvase RuvX [Minisyncoccia bacterium]